MRLKKWIAILMAGTLLFCSLTGAIAEGEPTDPMEIVKTGEVLTDPPPLQEGGGNPVIPETPAAPTTDEPVPEPPKTDPPAVEKPAATEGTETPTTKPSTPTEVKAAVPIGMSLSGAGRMYMNSSGTLTVSFSGLSNGQPKGKVTFSANGATIRSGVSVAGSVAAVSWTPTAPGTYTITATYNPGSGDGYSGGSASCTVEVAALERVTPATAPPLRPGAGARPVLRPDGSGYSFVGDESAFVTEDGSRIFSRYKKESPEGQLVAQIIESLTQQANGLLANGESGQLPGENSEGNDGTSNRDGSGGNDGNTDDVDDGNTDDVDDDKTDDVDDGKTDDVDDGKADDVDDGNTDDVDDGKTDDVDDGKTDDVDDGKTDDVDDGKTDDVGGGKTDDGVSEGQISAAGATGKVVSIDALAIVVTPPEALDDSALRGFAVSVSDADGNALAMDTDYTVSIASDDENGSVSLTIAGIGAFAGSVTKTFTIDAETGTVVETPALDAEEEEKKEGDELDGEGGDGTIDIGVLAIAVTPPEALDDSELRGFSVSVVDGDENALVMGTDYSVSVMETGSLITVVITGMGAYSGTASRNYTINGETGAIEEVPAMDASALGGRLPPPQIATSIQLGFIFISPTTITATVKDTSGTLITGGNVQFEVIDASSGTVLETSSSVPVASGTATWSFTPKMATISAYGAASGIMIRANYASVAPYAPSTINSGPYNATPGTTTPLQISLTVTGGQYGRPAELLATVFDGVTGTPITTGTVQFKVNATNIGSDTPNTAGIAAYTLTNVPYGSNTYTAVYSNGVLPPVTITSNPVTVHNSHYYYGNYGNFGHHGRYGSNRTPGIQLTAKASGSTATLTATMTTPYYGSYAPPNWYNNGVGGYHPGWYGSPQIQVHVSPTNYYWTVSPTAVGWNRFGGVPTGYVSFYNGNTHLGDAELVSGVAEFKWRNAPSGTHALRAVYHGNRYYSSASTSISFKMRASSSGSSSSNAPAAVGTQGLVWLFDQGGTTVETYNTANMLMQDGVLTLRTSRNAEYYCYGFQASHLRNLAGSSSAHFNLVTPSFSCFVPYSLGGSSVTQALQGSGLDLGDVQVRVIVQALIDDALTAAYRAANPGTQADISFYRIDAGLYKADGTPLSNSVDLLQQPLTLMLPVSRLSGTAQRYDASLGVFSDTTINFTDSYALVQVDNAGVYVVAIDP